MKKILKRIQYEDKYYKSKLSDKVLTLNHFFLFWKLRELKHSAVQILITQLWLLKINIMRIPLCKVRLH